MNREIIKQQEEVLQFDSFSNDIAIEIGFLILDKARKEGKSIAIDISKCGQQLFHAALAGTSADNDEWLRKKKNTVYRFYKSSLGIELDMKEHGLSLSDTFGLSKEDYVAAGGGFPINVKGVGFIGAIIVSGLTSADDHDLITKCLSVYLGLEICPQLVDLN